MDSRLSNVFVAVVPSAQKAQLRIVDSSDPAKIGTTIEGGPIFDELFLVNDGRGDIARVAMRTGGFASDDNDIIKLAESAVEFGAVKVGGARRLQILDPGMLDFMLEYRLDLHFSDGTRIAASFRIPKTYGFRPENYRFCRALGKQAYVFGLEPVLQSEPERNTRLDRLIRFLFRRRRG
jgi:hypothetical protein